MRHGQSEANRQGLIVSSPELALEAYGLSSEGKTQVLQNLKASTEVNKVSLIYSSDFLRARQTAELAREYLKLQSLKLDMRLRERFFGKWDGTSDQNYRNVWLADERSEEQTVDAVETVLEVANRMLSVVAELELIHTNQTILLVSHGDPLQILQAALMGRKPLAQRGLELLKTGEIRVLTQSLTV